MIKYSNNNPILIISHIADIDGMGSVILANYFFDKKVDYILCENNDIINILKEEPLDNYKTIYFCDLSLKEEVIDYLLNNSTIANKIKHFDHHASEVKNNIYPFINVISELNNRQTCATELFYLYLLTVDNNNVINKPYFKELVEAIRSQDTWDFKKYPNPLAEDLATLHFIIGSSSFIKVFSNQKITEHFIIAKDYQEIINAQKEQEQNYIKSALEHTVVTTFNNYKIGISLDQEYRSILGHAICTTYNVDYALIINFHRMRCSLRTEREDIDLGIIAKEYSNTGGGHKKAAGFNIDTFSLPIIKKLIIQYLDKLTK